MNVHSLKRFLTCSGTIFAGIILIPGMAFAGLTVNFYIGDVKYRLGSKVQPVENGMVIPDQAEIITGGDGRVALYDTKKGVVKNIGPGVTIPVSKIGDADTSKRDWYSAFQKNRIRHKPTAVASVRASEQGEVAINWSDTDDSAVQRSAEWELYRKGQYDSVLAKTKGASDEDGLYLEAMATYMLKGASGEEVIVDRLQQVEKMTGNRALQAECRKMMAMVKFELGKYSETMSYLDRLTRYSKDSEIDEVSYYMLIISNRYLGNESAEREYTRKMQKYHGKSELLRKL